MRGIEKKDLGKFRDSGVFIGHREKTGEYVVKHNPPYHTEKDISDAIVELFTWAEEDKNLHPLIRAGIIHHEFAYIHPFFDGNGRMARIKPTEFAKFVSSRNSRSKVFVLSNDNEKAIIKNFPIQYPPPNRLCNA